MLLAIDIGNSSVSLGVFNEERELMFFSGFEADWGKTRDQCAIEIRSIFRLYGAELRDVTGSVVSSVVPPVTPSIIGAVEMLTGCRSIVVGPGVKTGINILTDVQAQLGTDIVCAAVGAVNRYPTPLVVVDMGTAITVTPVTKDKAIPGCAIMPGVRTGLEAMAEKTAQLPWIALEEPKSVIGKNTIESMRSGVVYGTAGMIDSLVERMEAEIGEATVVATGGSSLPILKSCRREIVFNNHLVLLGLQDIYYKNLK